MTVTLFSLPNFFGPVKRDASLGNCYDLHTGRCFWRFHQKYQGNGSLLMAAPVNPKTVGELIENLKLYPPDWPISFSPFTLYGTKDRGEFVHFEINEVSGQDYTLHRTNEEESK